MSTSLNTAPKPKKNPYAHLWILIGLTIVFSIIAALMGVQLKVPGFLGTRATLGAGLAVILEIIGAITLWVGRSLARKRDIYKHKRVQTSVMLFNLVVIVFVMVVTFSQQVIGPGAPPNDPVVLLEIGHGISGVLLELLGLYIITRMWFEKVLPKWFLFKNFKLLMITTLFWWTVQTIGGVAIFAVRYLTAPIGSSALPAVVSPASGDYSSTPVTSGQASGSAAVRDDKVHSDSILITFQNVPQPPSGQEYVAWLIGNNGQFRLNVGALKVTDGNLTAQYTSPDGANLLRAYNEFLISIEPAGADHAQPSDRIAFSAIVPVQARAILNQLLVDAPDNSYQIGYLIDLLDSTRRLAKHIEIAQTLADNSDLVGVRRQAELIVNLLEGRSGPHYGDVDGDGQILSDGTGLGILTQALDKVKQVAQAAIDAPDASALIKLHAGHVIIGVDNARTWAQQIEDKALALAKVSDAATAKQSLNDLSMLAKNLLEGVDLNNDGRIDPVKGEGTIVVAYKHAQFADSPVYQAPLTIGGAPPSIPQEPAPPGPTQPAIPAVGANEVVVALENFAFNPATITIKVGEKVTWINRDSAPHTVTFDDGSFDSGALAQGQSASFTFAKAGEFAFYCLFHGGPSSVGMSGKIIVTP